MYGVWLTWAVGGCYRGLLTDRCDWNVATEARLAMVPNAHGAGDGDITAVCTLPGGAATGSLAGSVQRWDEGASALTPDGAVLQLGGGTVWSLTAAPGPDGALQLLAGCDDGTLRVLGTNGACGALQLQAALGGHSGSIHALTAVMTMQHDA